MDEALKVMFRKACVTYGSIMDRETVQDENVPYLLEEQNAF